EGNTEPRLLRVRSPGAAPAQPVLSPRARFPRPRNPVSPASALREFQLRRIQRAEAPSNCCPESVRIFEGSTEPRLFRGERPRCRLSGHRPSPQFGPRGLFGEFPFRSFERGKSPVKLPPAEINIDLEFQPVQRRPPFG